MRSAVEDSPWLGVAEVTKLYGGVVALDSASLSVRAGEVRGLVGPNGAGKSTLVKVLTGLVPPTRGTVVVDGRPLALGRPKEALRAGIVGVPQELTVAPAMTVAENVMLGHEPRVPLGFLRPRELRRRAQQVLDSLSLPVSADEIVGRLPLIQQRLVMVARALSFRARLVIFDEPTAAVSPLEVDLVLGAIQRLSERGVSVLHVSHRLDEIERVCDSVTVLRDGRVVADVGREQARHADLVRLLASGSETQAPARGDGAQGDPVLEIAGLGGERLRGIDLTVHAGEIVGLAGLAGSGARELLLTIAGAVPFAAGAVSVGGRRLPSGRPRASVHAGVAYLPGDRGLAAFPSESVAYNTSLPALARYSLGPFVRRDRERSAVAELLDRVGVRARPDAQMSSLSGGNQQRVIAARWIDSHARLLLLDDPSAGVDVATRPTLHRQVRALADGGAGVLLVSTDVDELVDLSDRVLAFDRGTVAGQLGAAELTAENVLAAMTGASTPGAPR